MILGAFTKSLRGLFDGRDEVWLEEIYLSLFGFLR